MVRTQCEHEKYNSTHCPGTRQLCSLCEEPTGRCEEDSLFLFNINGPVCENCYVEEVWLYKLELILLDIKGKRCIQIDTDTNYMPICTSELDTNDIKSIIKNLKLFIVELEDCLKESQ